MNLKRFILILAMICGLTVLGAQGSAGGSKTIPGIDSMPRAIDPDYKPRTRARAQEEARKASEPKKDEPGKDEPKKEEPKKEEAAKDEPKKEEPKKEEPKTAGPAIKNIRVEKIDGRADSAKITWEYSGQNDSPVFVGRYEKPTVSYTEFLDTDNLTSPPLGPKETSFIDRKIADGKYFYVVVTKKEIDMGEKIPLVAAANYSVQPIEIALPKSDRDKQDPNKDQPKVNEDDFKVFNLLAVNSDKSVKLNWSPARARNVLYMVYRSPTPLASNPLAVARSPRLATVEQDTLYFEDKTPIDGKEVYYGIAVVDLATGTEFRKLAENVSTIRHKFAAADKAKDDVLELLPDVLTAVQTNKTTVKLYWAKPDKEVTDYRIYRHDRPIFDEAMLSRAELVGRSGGRETSYADTELKPGQYFYAVLPRDGSGREVRAFREGRTFTGFAVSVLENRLARDETEVYKKDEPKKEEAKKEEPKKEEIKKEEPVEETIPKIAYFRAEGREGAVKLTFELEKSKRKDIRLIIYRSDKPLRNMNEVKAGGLVVAELDRTETEYHDTGVPAGRAYYALLIEAGGKVQEKMIEGKNFPREPVVVRSSETIIKEEPDKPKKEETGKDEIVGDKKLTDLNRVLANTYWQKRYADTIREMAAFTGTGAASDPVKAKALFYTGLAYYHLRDFDRAVPFFLNGLVQREFPERSRFWYRRAVERVR